MLLISLACVVLTLSSTSALQSTIVGRVCTESTECGRGGYCASNKRCDCLTTYISIDGYCWQKINPGEAGCTRNRQCDAVWPGAYCSSGKCRCGNNQPPFKTRDGFVCVNYGTCPVNGNYPKLKSNTNQVITCNKNDFLCPEAYECICTDSTCSSSSTSFCCPGRAMSCIQEMDEGTFPSTGGSPLSHYYHDPVTGDCKTFQYRGQGGNGNNFQTKEHCESYCKQSCERGMPLYTAQDTTNPTTKQSVVACTSSTICTQRASTNLPNRPSVAGYDCTTVGTLQQCCPTAKYICSKYGGLTYDFNIWPTVFPPTNNYDEGNPSPESMKTARYYYDITEKRCLTFSYTGQGGNFNNFLSQTHCEQYCSKVLCDAGTPLKDSGGVINLNCGGSDSNCPTSHQCKNNVCCPRKQFVCKMAKAQGNCGSYTTRWWFNAASGNCEEFLYSGCQGNDNNFGTYTDCQDFCRDTKVEPQCVQGKALTDTNNNYVVCGGTGATTTCPANYYCYYDGNTYGCCPNQAYTCALGYDSGRECGPGVTRWYYDSTTKTCLTFSYDGCDGNSNNFATQSDCKDYCRVSSCPDGGDYMRDLSGIARNCKSDTNCPNTHYCTPISSTTGGIVTIASYCCPSKNYVCSQYKDEGVKCSSTTISRYWFNRVTRTCDTFTYNGCSGNRNNFATKKACENFCLSAACPTGTVVSSDSDTARLTTCTNPGGVGNAAGGCAEGYTCVAAQLLGQNVCCGASVALQTLCPASSLPYVSAVTLQALQCTPNLDGSCPGNYFCWFSARSSSNAYYCCAGTSGGYDYCPPQLSPISGGTTTYKYCSPNASPNDVSNSCGVSNFCQYARALSRYICCGSGQARKPNVCPPQPAGLEPVYSGMEYYLCDPNAAAGTTAACRGAAACLYTDPTNKYICCQPKSATTSTMQPVVYISTTTVGPVPTKDPLSKDCSGQIGFEPVQPYPSTCSPFIDGSCNQFKPQGSLVRCLWSSNQSKFICCHSRFNSKRSQPSSQTSPD